VPLPQGPPKPMVDPVGDTTQETSNLLGSFLGRENRGFAQTKERVKRPPETFFPGHRKQKARTCFKKHPRKGKPGREPFGKLGGHGGKNIKRGPPEIDQKKLQALKKKNGTKQEKTL